MVVFAVAVPRYENAAKSNYWTMNQEGFEEFGSENSFKRRRRRGQTIPISTYKQRKCFVGESRTHSCRRCMPLLYRQRPSINFISPSLTTPASGTGRCLGVGGGGW